MISGRPADNPDSSEILLVLSIEGLKRKNCWHITTIAIIPLSFGVHPNRTLNDDKLLLVH